MGTHAQGPDPLAAAVGAVAEGVTFYDLAHVAAADVRVKIAFEDLGVRKRTQLEKLEALAGSEARSAAPAPGFYPIADVSRLECYVCGHILETQAHPAQCPKCGAAGYAFEKEITLAKAWQIAGTAARKTAEFLRGLAARSKGEGKALLEALAAEEDRLAGEADAAHAELMT